MLKLQSVSLRVLDLPFREAFRHSLASRSRMASLWVRITTAEGALGYGEGTPREYVTGESLAGAMEQSGQVQALLEGQEISDLATLEALLAGDFWQQWPSLRCAVELAALDLLAKAKSKTVLELLGEAASSTVQYSAVLSGGALAGAIRQAEMAKQLGVTQVKLKVGERLAENLELVRSVREVVGPQAQLRVDANAAWSLAEARIQIPALAEAGVVWVEQPLPVAPPSDYPVLQAEVGQQAEIILDESITQLEDAQWMAARGGPRRLLLKISKVGGLLPALRLARWAQIQEMPLHLGCHVGESSILSAAGRVFAALAPCDSIEGSFGTLLLQEDVTDTPLMFGKAGEAPVRYSSRPGWGITLRQEWL